MSFIGNFAAADAAKKIGRYNNELFQTQADYQAAKARIRKKTYDQVTRPLLVKNFKKQYSAFKVNALNNIFLDKLLPLALFATTGFLLLFP